MATIVSQPTGIEDYRSYSFAGYDRDGRAICGGSYGTFEALRRAMRSVDLPNMAAYDITGVDLHGFPDDITMRAVSHVVKLERDEAERWEKLDETNRAKPGKAG